MRQRFVLLFMLISLLSGLLIGISSAQGTSAQEVDTSAAFPQAFTAYSCSFDRNSNRAQIQVIYMNANGQRVPRGDFRAISVTQIDTDETLPSRDIEITPLATRSPMRLMIVLDVTETVPLLEIKQALVENLIPGLLPEDQVALVTFGAAVGEPSPFFTDKNRLVNEFLLDLDIERGNNRVYDALLQSVDMLDNFPASERRTILMLTDSGQRVDEQASVDEIIRLSQASGIQIFPIGFYTRDTPDVEILQRIAYETDGFGWFYEDTENSRSSIQSNVASFLNDFHVALNSEMRVDVLAPVPSAAVSGLAQYRLAVVQASEQQGFETTIDCPVDELNHSITFAGDTFSHITPDPLTVDVNIESDLSAEAVQVRFFVDNQPVQTSASRTFVFQTSQAVPGLHEIRAQLLDRNDTVLTTTVDPITIYAQQAIDVAITSGSLEALDRAISMNIVTGTGINLNNVVVNLYAPDVAVPKELSRPSISDGRGSFTIRNLQADIVDFAPSAATGDIFQLRIEVPGSAPSEPPLAQPYVIDVPYVAPITLAAQQAQPLPRWVQILVNIRNEPRLMLFLITLALLLFNLLLFRAVRRLQIQKLIARPDKIELSESLMTVTVRSEDEKKSYPLTKKTMFVGRGETNDIILGNSEQLSRRHGVIMWRRGRWWYTNRKSDVQSVVEGRRVRGMKLFALEPITEIEFPDAVLIFHYGSQQNIEALFNTDLGDK
jgi:hypothetical protein